MRQFQFWLLAVLLCGATAVLWTYPLVQHLGSGIPLGSETVPTVTLFNVWTMIWNSKSISNFYNDFWNAPIFFPLENTFAFSDPQPFSGVLFHILQSITTDRVSAYGLLILLTLMLNGCGACFFLRRLGVSNIATLISSVFAVTLPFVSRELGVLQIASIYPVLFSWGIFLVFAEKQRIVSSVLLGAAVGITFLTCSYYGVYQSLLLPLCGLCWLRRQHFKLKPILFSALAVLVCVVLITPLLLKQGPQGVNKPRSLKSIINTSAHYHHYRSLDSMFAKAYSVPWLVAHDQYKGAQVPQDLYPGTGLLLCAVVGLVLGMRSREYRRATVFLFTLGAVGLMLSFGPKNPAGGTILYDFVLHFHPGFPSLRSPYRFSVFLQIALLGLSALSINRLCASTKRDGVTIAMVLVLFSLFEIKPSAQRTYPLSSRLESYQQLDQQMAQLADGPVAFYPASRGGSIRNFEHTVIYMLLSIDWNRSLVNGYSGFFPKQVKELREVIRNLPLSEDPSALQENGVRYLLADKQQSKPYYLEKLRNAGYLTKLFESRFFVGFEILYESRSEVSMPFEE